jgi:hypothetical protein
MSAHATMAYMFRKEHVYHACEEVCAQILECHLMTNFGLMQQTHQQNLLLVGFVLMHASRAPSVLMGILDFFVQSVRVVIFQSAVNASRATKGTT